MGDNDDIKMDALYSKEYKTSALVLIYEARRDIQNGWLKSADENLATASRLLIDAGAEDIGAIPYGRDLNEDISTVILNKERQIDKLEERISDLESDIKNSKGELERNKSRTIKERITSILS